MQLPDLIKPLSEMTDEEIQARIIELRHKRDVVRPAARKHAERAAKVGSQTKITKTADLLNGLSEADRAALIELLGE